jgi:hypothetical protein
VRLEPHLDRLLDVVVESVVERLLAAESPPQTTTPAGLLPPAGANSSQLTGSLDDGNSRTAAPGAARNGV